MANEILRSVYAADKYKCKHNLAQVSRTAEHGSSKVSVQHQNPPKIWLKTFAVANSIAIKLQLLCWELAICKSDQKGKLGTHAL